MRRLLNRGINSNTSRYRTRNLVNRFKSSPSATHIPEYDFDKAQYWGSFQAIDTERLEANTQNVIIANKKEKENDENNNVFEALRR